MFYVRGKFWCYVSPISFFSCSTSSGVILRFWQMTELRDSVNHMLRISCSASLRRWETTVCNFLFLILLPPYGDVDGYLLWSHFIILCGRKNPSYEETIPSDPICWGLTTLLSIIVFERFSVKSRIIQRKRRWDASLHWGVIICSSEQSCFQSIRGCWIFYGRSRYTSGRCSQPKEGRRRNWDRRRNSKKLHYRFRFPSEMDMKMKKNDLLLR